MKIKLFLFHINNFNENLFKHTWARVATARPNVKAI